MNNWQEFKLADLGKVITGKTPSTKIKENFDGVYPFITIPDITDLPYITKTERTISELGFKSMKNLLLPKDSVFMSCIATVGKCGITTKPSFTNQQINSIICNNNLIKPKFLYYVFKNITNLLDSYGGGGSVYTNISKSKFESIKILLPPFTEQKEIAGILSALDNKIEANNKQNETLESMAMAIFKSWFIDFEPFGGKQPSNWQEKKLSDICKIVYGKELPTKNLLNKGYPVFGGNGKIGFYSQYMYENPQVIISCRGLASGKVMHSLKKSFITNNSLICEIKNTNEVNRFYLERMLKFIDLTRFTTGSAQPQITIGNIANISILIPTEKIMANFEKLLDTIDAKISFNNDFSITLANIRDSLLPRLITGKIRVPYNIQDNKNE